MLVRFYDPSPWKGKDVYIISGTAKADKKVEFLQRRMGIPKENIYASYSEATVASIYKKVQARRAADPNARSLLALDDVTSHLTATQNGGILGEIAYESRHYGLSVVLLTQKWTSVPTSVRENLSGAVVWGCAQRQVAALANDLNRLDSSAAFFKMMKNCTSGDAHDFMVARLNKPVRDMYLDTHFNPIRPAGDVDDEEQPAKKRRYQPTEGDDADEENDDATPA